MIPLQNLEESEMSIRRAFSIVGVGKYLPKRIVKSSEIERKLGLPKGFIHKNIGVESRHVAKDETNTFMGEQALRKALQDAKLQISDIDFLIGASATFDYIIPNRSCMIKSAFEEAEELGFPCIDMNAVCTSFISAMDYAAMLLETNEYKNIAIVSSEISSKGLNPSDAKTYGLFGDGAAAIILSKTDEETGLIKQESKTYVKAVKYTIIEGGGNMNHTRDVPYDPALYSFKMEGRKLLSHVKPHLTEYLSLFFQKSTGSMQEVDLIIPHQASKLGFKMLTMLNQGKEDNIVNELENHGNCIAASIPLALVSSIQNGRLKEGDSCFLVGTAAGVTISGMLFRYGRK